MTEIARRTPAAVEVLTDLRRFETVVLELLDGAGLPTADVFVDVSERQVMLANMPAVLRGLDDEVLIRSSYVSKMIAAASVGLFDAALNYLWDELVSELRRRVVGFDLAYFYDIAASSSDLRRHLRTAEDLPKVDDANLLRAAREIGLLTEVGFARLDHIRYMRNHASAAHPNQVQLTGLDLAQWLQVCISQVITLPPDTVTAQTGRLLANLKKDRLEDDAVSAAAVFFDQLPSDRAVTLANGLFGLYVDPTRSPVVADNVRKLWPQLWPFLDEEPRRSYGVRCARFGASADHGQAAAARELIDLVDGSAYLPDELWVVEIDRALDILLAAHHGWNNFYNEGPPARELERLVGDRDTVPGGIAGKYVRVLVQCYLGNGNGVAFAADPIYARLLERLGPDEAQPALRSFQDETIASLLWNRTPRRQWVQLLDVVEPKLTRSSDRELLAAIRVFPGTPDQLRQDTSIKRLAAPRTPTARRGQ